jgi:hypothetical protein
MAPNLVRGPRWVRVDVARPERASFDNDEAFAGGGAGMSAAAQLVIERSMQLG